MKKFVLVALVLSAMCTSVDARPRGYTCGLFMRQLTGGQHGPKFNLALHWATLSRGHAAPGMVLVQRRAGRALGGGPGGHVAMIREILGPCKARVQDNRGTYVRNTCKGFVAYVHP